MSPPAPSPRAPCRPHWPAPGRAGRSWSRCPGEHRARDARRCASRADGTAGSGRWSTDSRSGAAAHRAASSRVRSRPRSGHDRTTADWRDCVGGGRSTGLRRCPPCPSACRGGRSWPSVPRPSQEHGWRWRVAGGAMSASGKVSKYVRAASEGRAFWTMGRTAAMQSATRFTDARVHPAERNRASGCALWRRFVQPAAAERWRPGAERGRAVRRSARNRIVLRTRPSRLDTGHFFRRARLLSMSKRLCSHHAAHYVGMSRPGGGGEET